MKILTFSTLFPNAVATNHGLFVERRLQQLLASAGGSVQARVMAPVPWFPFSGRVFGEYAGYSQVPPHETRDGLAITHPRFPVIPKLGMSIAPLLLYQAVRPRVRELLESGYDFDLIDAHYYYPDGVAAVLLGRHFDRPVTITARGTDINLLPNYRLPRRQILWAARHAGHSITVSGALRDRLVALGADPGRVTVLRNGVDAGLFHPAADRDRLRQDLGVDGVVLLSVGNLIELKGHHLAIEALRELPGDTRLLIAGKGPMEGELRALARAAGVEGRVRFEGLLDRAELVKRYAAADLLVLASSREGMPNVVLEAMACGTPVIASNVGGIPELVDAGVGRLLERRDAASIARAVAALRSGPVDRESVRTHARRFSWEATSRGQIELFNTIIAARERLESTTSP